MLSVANVSAFRSGERLQWLRTPSKILGSSQPTDGTTIEEKDGWTSCNTKVESPNGHESYMDISLKMTDNINKTVKTDTTLIPVIGTDFGTNNDVIMELEIEPDIDSEDGTDVGDGNEDNGEIHGPQVCL